jgi:hypothetical protein
MRSIFLSILVILLAVSCKKDTYVNPDYLVFGAIQGNCSQGCRFVYYLDDNKLAEDSTVKYFSTKNLADFKRALGDDKFTLAKELKFKVPVALTETTRNIFIDLNASTPNLWYAEIRLNGRIYSWTFDNSKSGTPAYLKPFADEIIRISELIR